MQIFMFRNTMVKWLSFVFGAFLSIGWFLPADVEAYGESKQLRLPRSFEGARLGMTRGQLPVAVPEADKLSKTSRHAINTVIASVSGNPYVSRIEYRFFQGAFQDIVIHCTSNRIPRGYEGLLDKLKESYSPCRFHWKTGPGYCTVTNPAESPSGDSPNAPRG
jgi:hypothetical protein